MFFFKWVAKKDTLDIQARSFLNLRVTSVEKTISSDGQILATPPSKKGLPPPNDKGLTRVYIVRPYKSREGRAGIFPNIRHDSKTPRGEFFERH